MFLSLFLSPLPLCLKSKSSLKIKKTEDQGSQNLSPCLLVPPGKMATFLATEEALDICGIDLILEHGFLFLFFPPKILKPGVSVL